MTEPYINDIYVPYSLEDEVKANGSRDGKFSLSRDELRNNMITDIMSISFPIEITTTGGDIVDRSAYKKVTTNKYDTETQNYDVGKIVYEDEKVEIQYLDLISKPLPNSTNNKQLRLFVHNKTDGALSIGIDSKSIFINDEKQNIVFNNIIPARKYGI